MDITIEKIKKIFWCCAGFIFLVLAIIGFAMPVLPGTIFLAMSAFCFMKGSKKMYNWIISNKYLGKHIQDYQEGNGITLGTKIGSITTLWMSIIVAAIFISQLWWAKIILIVFAIGVTIHILDQKTKEKEEKK